MSDVTAFAGLNAAIAEDSAHMRALLRSMLRALGFAEVIANASGKDTLRLITAGWPDVVLLDWNMPGMSGIDVVQKMKALPAPFCRIPIMIITAHASPQRLAQSKALGVNAFLCKPISIKVLESRLSKIVFGARPEPEPELINKNPRTTVATAELSNKDNNGEPELDTIYV